MFSPEILNNFYSAVWVTVKGMSGIFIFMLIFFILIQVIDKVFPKKVEREVDKDMD